MRGRLLVVEVFFNHGKCHVVLNVTQGRNYYIDADGPPYLW